MDIFQIIRDNLPELPEGVTISDKAVKAIEKEIKAQQGLEFIPKAQYAKKTDRIAELETELSEAQGKAADADGYKAKYEAEVAAHSETKTTMKKEYDDFKATVETEKTATAKQTALRKHLETAGANPKLTALLEKEFDLAKVELDGEAIKGWDDMLKPVKERYTEVFGKVTTQGTDPANPPKDEKKEKDLFIEGFDDKK